MCELQVIEPARGFPMRTARVARGMQVIVHEKHKHKKAIYDDTYGRGSVGCARTTRFALRFML
jgi:hypothetical protein